MDRPRHTPNDPQRPPQPGPNPEPDNPDPDEVTRIRPIPSRRLVTGRKPRPRASIYEDVAQSVIDRIFGRHKPE